MTALRGVFGAPPRRLTVALLLVLAASLLLSAAGQPARAAVLTMRCTNPVSGTSWDVAVDADRALVDTLPAEISEKWVSWQDPAQNGHYDLERATGKLTGRFPSSTGGYFLYYQCRSQ